MEGAEGGVDGRGPVEGAGVRGAVGGEFDGERVVLFADWEGGWVVFLSFFLSFFSWSVCLFVWLVGFWCWVGFLFLWGCGGEYGMGKEKLLMNGWLAAGLPMLIGSSLETELSLTVPITNSLAFLFTVLGEWWAEGKVISRGMSFTSPRPPISTARLLDIGTEWYWYWYWCCSCFC